MHQNKWRLWICVGVLYVSFGLRPFVYAQRSELFTVGFGFSDV